MIRLKVEGPQEEVQAFLDDFVCQPQYKIKGRSLPYQEDRLTEGEIRSFCHFEYMPKKHYSVVLVVAGNEEIQFDLEDGQVEKEGEKVLVTGKVVKLLPQIAVAENKKRASLKETQGRNKRVIGIV